MHCTVLFNNLDSPSIHRIILILIWVDGVGGRSFICLSSFLSFSFKLNSPLIYFYPQREETETETETETSRQTDRQTDGQTDGP